MTLNLSQQIETKLATAARQMGIDPSALIEQIIEERFPSAEEKSAPKISPKNAAALAYFERRLKDEATDDPEEIRKADAEVEELMQNLNRNRIEAGESSLFP